MQRVEEIEGGEGEKEQEEEPEDGGGDGLLAATAAALHSGRRGRSARHRPSVASGLSGQSSFRLLGNRRENPTNRFTRAAWRARLRAFSFSACLLKRSASSCSVSLFPLPSLDLSSVRRVGWSGGCGSAEGRAAVLAFLGSLFPLFYFRVPVLVRVMADRLINAAAAADLLLTTSVPVKIDSYSLEKNSLRILNSFRNIATG